MRANMLGMAILCGGASSRMGVDKGGLDWLGRRGVDRLAETGRQLRAAHILTVGSQDFGLPRTVEQPPRSGPVAGALAGARALRDLACQRALIVAVDAPTLTPEDLGPLLALAGGVTAYEGLHLPFLADIQALEAVDGARGDWPIRRLLDRAGARWLPAPQGAGTRLRGANTPEERDALLAELATRSGA